MKEALQKSFGIIREAFQELSDEDKAQFIFDCTILLNDKFDIDMFKKVAFPGMNELIEMGKVKRWKPSYLLITINYYESKEHRRVFGRLKTFAKKKGFEIIEKNAGRDFPDTHHEISMGLRNQWVEYRLQFDHYIDQDEVFEFLGQFGEIKIGGKE